MNPSLEPGAKPARLVVLVSGGGSNLQAILDACEQGELGARVVAVISNKKEAFALQRAERAGVRAIYFPKEKQQDRRAYDAKLAELVAEHKPDYVVLAGWMRILSQVFLDAFPGKVINLHPALPGRFPGTHAIERAFEAFQRGEVTCTGVMVHLVPDEDVDSGPVLAEQEIPILESDTLESLAERLHQLERLLLVKALKKLLTKQSELQ
ncbi:MAG: phosphoribosylglycinamide formyltransferase [Deinococcus sp.]|nr:phosphoribosylglycinamide formyltransferase [Deinococcus sp.]MCL5964778.1 phosphoribosylglycinamide formyltransferase [Deinococcus sp.]